MLYKGQTQNSLASCVLKPYITPNTPPGPRAPPDESVSAPAHAAGDLTSKKYVQLSSLAPTNATAAGGAFGAIGSFSHNSDMIVDFRRVVGFEGRFDSRSRSSSSPCINPDGSMSSASWFNKERFLSFESQGEPPV